MQALHHCSIKHCQYSVLDSGIPNYAGACVSVSCPDLYDRFEYCRASRQTLAPVMPNPDESTPCEEGTVDDNGDLCSQGAADEADDEQPDGGEDHNDMGEEGATSNTTDDQDQDQQQGEEADQEQPTLEPGVPEDDESDYPEGSATGEHPTAILPVDPTPAVDPLVDELATGSGADKSDGQDGDSGADDVDGEEEEEDHVAGTPSGSHSDGAPGQPPKKNSAAPAGPLEGVATLMTASMGLAFILAIEAMSRW